MVNADKQTQITSNVALTAYNVFNSKYKFRMQTAKRNAGEHDKGVVEISVVSI